jgi:hypothetical protein
MGMFGSLPYNKKNGVSCVEEWMVYDMQNIHRLAYPPSLHVDYPPILFLASW